MLTESDGRYKTMYQVDRNTERLILDASVGDDYDVDVALELDYWTLRDFEDVLPSYQPTAAEDT